MTPLNLAARAARETGSRHVDCADLQTQPASPSPAPDDSKVRSPSRQKDRPARAACGRESPGNCRARPSQPLRTYSPHRSERSSAKLPRWNYEAETQSSPGSPAPRIAPARPRTIERFVRKDSSSINSQWINSQSRPQASDLRPQSLRAPMLRSEV